jgi:hypothetical protein
MLEEVSFLSAIGVSLPLQQSPPWYARKRLPIALKIAMPTVSNEQMYEKREGFVRHDPDRTGDPLLAEREGRFGTIFQSSRLHSRRERRAVFPDVVTDIELALSIF